MHVERSLLSVCLRQPFAPTVLEAGLGLGWQVVITLS